MVRQAFLRGLVPLLALAAVLAFVVGPKLAGSHTREDVSPAPVFLTNALGRPQADAPLVRRPGRGLIVRLNRAGLSVSDANSWVSLAAKGVGRAGWRRFANGVSRPTGFGRETILTRPTGAEEFLTVGLHQGTKTWQWSLGDPKFRPRLASDGRIEFLSDGKLAGFWILPVKIYDRVGTDITPPGLRWSLAHQRGSWWLSLKLDDSKLPVPYVIDPSVSNVSFAGSPQTGGARSTWTVGFKTSPGNPGGALAAGSTITVAFNSAFSVPASPTVSLTSGASNCSASGSTSGTTVTIALANSGGTCAIAKNTTVTLTIAGITNPAAGSYAASTFSVATSVDTTATNPGSAVTISAATSVGSVTFTGASQVFAATTTWTAGFTTSSTGALAAGHTITVAFNSSFTIPASPTVTLASGFTSCSATGSTSGSTVTVTLANSGGTCSLPNSTAATLTIAGITNPAAGSYAASTFSIATSTDTVAASPASAAIISGAPTKLAITSLNNGSNPTAGSAFSVSVQVQDSNNNPAPATQATDVSLSLKTGTGTLGGTTAGTVSAGSSTVTINNVTYTKAESGVVLTATRTGGDTLTDGDSASFTVNPGSADHLTFTSSTADLTSGSARTLTVEVRDANNNKVTTDNGRTITFAKQSGTGTVTGLGTATTSSGGASKSVTGQTAGSITIEATATGLTTGTTTFTIVAGSADHLTFTSSTTDLTSGSARTLTVEVRDANNNKVTTDSGRSISLSRQGGSTGTVDDLASSVTTSGGTASDSVTAHTAGSITIKATSQGLTSATTTFTIVPGPADHLSFIGNSSNALTSGDSRTLTVDVRDANENLVTDNGRTVSFAKQSGAGTVSGLPGTDTTSGGNASKSVTGLAAGSITIEATASGLTTGTVTFTINAGAFSKLQLLVPGETAAPGSASGKTGTPTAQTAGSAFTVTVNAVDANWNLVNTVTDTVSLSSSDANATLPANAALVAGTKDLSVTLKTAGSRTLTASDLSDGTKSSATSPAITVDPGAFSKLQLLVPGETAAPGSASGKTGTPTAQTAGSAFTVTVNAVDANWNVVGTITDTVHLESSDGNAELPADTALVSGTTTLSVTLKTATPTTLTAADATDGAKSSATSPSITVVPGAAVKVVLSGLSADLGAGSDRTLTATIEDAFDNTVTSSSALVSFQQTGGTGSVTGTGSVNAVNGVATKTVTGKTAGSVTITASSTGLTSGSISFTVVPGSAAWIEVTGSAGNLGSASNRTITATIHDAQGNVVTTDNSTQVTFSQSAGAGSVTGTGSGTASSGVATTTVTGQLAGPVTIQASAASLTSGTISFDVVPGPASSATTTISANPTAIVADGTTSSTITVQAKDAAGNTLTSSGGTVTLSTTAGSLSDVTDNGNGTYTATLTSTSAGTATITGTIAGDAITDDGTVELTAVNHAPTCEDTTLATYQNTPGDAEPDCSDPDGDTLTFSVVSQGDKGMASVVDGRLHYVPDANATGSDRFSYKASDGSEDSNVAAVEVTITAGTVPDTTIETHPADPSNDASPTFTFSSGVSGSTFECSLDESDFAACSSPLTLSGLTEGSHTFRGRAVAHGHADPTPASFTWTIDLTPPETAIDSSPSSPSGASVSFTFTSNEPGSTFECQLDDGPFQACTSPQAYNKLSDGQHAFRVKATDASGNMDPSPAVFRWTVQAGDQTAPETSLDSAPLSPSASSVVFTFSANEAGSTFECMLDGGAFEPCTSPKSYADLSEGSHTFQVRATDRAGNTDQTPASYTWSVNPAPRLIASDPKDGASVQSVSGLTLTADESVQWTDVTVTRLSDGNVTTLANLADGVEYSSNFSATVPSLYTVRATISDGVNAPVLAVIHFTIPSPGGTTTQPVAATAVTGEPGSLTTSDGSFTMEWPAAAVADVPDSDALEIVIDQQETQSPPADGWEVGSDLFDITAQMVKAGTPVKSFSAPLHFTMAIADLALVPFVHEDGSDWRQLEEIQNPHELPAGWRDGYYIDNKKCKDSVPEPFCLHILTVHLTAYMLAKPKPGAPLQFKVNSPKRLTLSKTSFNVRVSVNLPVTVTFTLRTRRGTPVSAWKVKSRSGVSYPTLKLVPRVSNPGLYSLTSVASGHLQTKIRRATITFKRTIPPIVKLGPKVGVTIVATTAPPSLPLPSRYEITQTSEAEQVWDDGSSPSRNVSILVIDVDVPGFGVDFVRDLHMVFPNMKFIGLTSSPQRVVELYRIKPKGTAWALMKPVRPATLAKLIVKISQPPKKKP